MSNIFEKMKEKKSEADKQSSSKILPQGSRVSDPLPTSKKAVDALKKKSSSSTTTTTPRKDTKLQKLEKEFNSFKQEVQRIIQDLKESMPTGATNRKLTYEEFKNHMISHKNAGTHYSSYVNQLKYKESDFKNFYLIYLDLP